MEIGSSPPPIDTQATDSGGFFLDRFRSWLSNFYTFITNYVNNTGIKFPVMTTAERDLLTAKQGQTIFNSDIGNPQIYDGVTWQTIPYL